MFDLFKGFGKASKLKQLLSNAKARLQLLKNKRRCCINRTRDDVSHLIKHGDSLVAFNKAGDIYKDEIMIEIYGLLHDYCDVVAVNLSYIFQHKDVCPDEDDIIEAVSTLIYTYAKFDEIPELYSIGVLFGKCYSYEFVKTAVELRPGNHVKFSAQIDEALNMKDVHDYVKLKLLKEIDGSCYYVPGPIEYDYGRCLDEENEIESNRSWISSCEEENEIESRTSWISSCEEENEIESNTSQISSCEEENEIESNTSQVSSCEEENEIGSSTSWISSCEEENEIESNTSQVSSCEEESVLGDVTCGSMKFSDDPSENYEILIFLETYCD